MINAEVNYIDILIKTETNCIIVENKLNWAGDRNEQLFRYYNECKNNKKLEVDKIVYLSPNSWKQPEEQSIKEIPKELIKTIIGYDGENNDFYTMVLQKSLEEMNNKEPKEWLLLLEHYLKILRQTGVTKMDTLTKKFYEKIKEEPQEYEKIKLIVDMYNNLTTTRANSLISKFINGKIWGNPPFVYFDFYIKDKRKNYAINIFVNKYDYSNLYLYSRENDREKFEQDNKDIEAWLKKHNLFEGFEKDETWYNEWNKNFKFPEEENELYDFTEKLIECLEKDVESIYSEK